MFFLILRLPKISSLARGDCVLGLMCRYLVGTIPASVCLTRFCFEVDIFHDRVLLIHSVRSLLTVSFHAFARSVLRIGIELLVCLFSFQVGLVLAQKTVSLFCLALFDCVHLAMFSVLSLCMANEC